MSIEEHNKHAKRFPFLHASSFQHPHDIARYERLSKVFHFYRRHCHG